MTSTIDKQHLVKLASWTMPFGKYQGRALINLPEEYLLWFARKGFPAGELGQLMELALALKIEGLDEVLRPLVASVGASGRQVDRSNRLRRKA